LKLDLDRSVGFFELIEPDTRGVCWDDSTRNYLTNQKLNYALNYICSNILHDRFKIIGFDACLMAMAEVGHMMKNYANIMVASEEVELGTGWNYSTALEQFLTTSPNMYDLAKNIVFAYNTTYCTVTNDYTLSAVDLNSMHILEKNIDDSALLLSYCLKNQKNNSVKLALQASRNKLNCTHFDEPSYIDLYDFYTNLEKNIRYFVLQANTENVVQQLQSTIAAGKNIIESIVFANVAGKNLAKAHGISIYFPEIKMHSSYPSTPFATSNSWIDFITLYLSK
jgi:hypothetical protein